MLTRDCYFDNDNFLRHCEANGGWNKMLYNLSPEQCMLECNNNRDCVLAHHHPSFQIWSHDHRTNCWMWSARATACPWGTGATLANHPGATMIKCGKRKTHII